MIPVAAEGGGGGGWGGCGTSKNNAMTSLGYGF